MKTEGFTIALSFNQVVALVKQLPMQQKVKLSKELEKEGIISKLTALLNEFRTAQLSQSDIDKEVEHVRAKRYAKEKKA